MSHTGDALSKFFLQVQAKAKPSPLVGHQSEGGVYHLGQDLVGGGGRHLFDLHPPCPAPHHHGGGSGPVEDNPKIKLPVGLHGLLNEDLLHLLTLGPRLGRDQLSAEEGAGDFFGLRRPFHQLHPSSFSPSPCMDLGLDHHRAAKLLSQRAGPLWGLRHTSLGDRDAEVFEDRLGLIFVDLHIALFKTFKQIRIKALEKGGRWTTLGPSSRRLCRPSI